MTHVCVGTVFLYRQYKQAKTSKCADMYAAVRLTNDCVSYTTDRRRPWNKCAKRLSRVCYVRFTLTTSRFKWFKAHIQSEQNKVN